MKRHPRWQIYTRKDGQIGIRMRAANGKIVLFEGYQSLKAVYRAIAIASKCFHIEDCRKRKK